MCKLSVKATCQNLPHMSVPSHSFLTRLICPSPRHLSAQIVLLINYAIIPIRWLIAGSSSTFLPQISSFTTLATTGVQISDSASSCMTLQLHSDADLRQAASLATSDWPPGITTSVVSSCGLTGKSAGSLRHTITEQPLWFGSVQDLTSVQLRECQHMREDVGQSKAENTKNVKFDCAGV